MKDRDADTRLTQHLSGEPPREAFRHLVLRDSTAEFVRIQRRRSALRRAGLAAAAVLIAGVAFLGGRLSMPSALPPDEVETPPVEVASDGVNVPNELVVWLDAARLFKQLGMEDRMARAVERAGRLLPTGAYSANGRAARVFAVTESAENQTELVEPTDVLGPNPSAKCANQILAQTLGD